MPCGSSGSRFAPAPGWRSRSRDWATTGRRDPVTAGRQELCGSGRLAAHLELRRLVQTKLKENLSPRQISVELHQLFPDDPEMWVSHETIYQSIYVQTRGALRRELAIHLRTGRALRKPRRRADQRRGRIPNMVNISQRPAEVEDRAIPGHWEGDLMMGKSGRSAIGTLVERSTRFVSRPGRAGRYRRHPEVA